MDTARNSGVRVKRGTREGRNTQSRPGQRRTFSNAKAHASQISYRRDHAQRHPEGHHWGML